MSPPFYVTVDRDDLRTGEPLLYFDAAYRIARAMAVAAVRKESASEIHLSQIEDNIEALGTWSEGIADMLVKARIIQKSGKLIEEYAESTESTEDQKHCFMDYRAWTVSQTVPSRPIARFFLRALGALWGDISIDSRTGRGFQGGSNFAPIR